MKKLLTTITLSAFVGTITNSLQPTFAQKIVNTSFKSNQLKNKNIRITNENDTNSFISKIIDIDTNKRVTSSIIAHNGIIYVDTAFGQGSLSASKLYKSTGGINFIEIKSWNQNYCKSKQIESLVVDSKNNIYVGTGYGLYKSTGGIES